MTINYNKQPFRACRWITRQHEHKGRNDIFWCQEQEGTVDQIECFECFCGRKLKLNFLKQ